MSVKCELMIFPLFILLISVSKYALTTTKNVFKEYVVSTSSPSKQLIIVSSKMQLQTREYFNSLPKDTTPAVLKHFDEWKVTIYTAFFFAQ